MVGYLYAGCRSARGGTGTTQESRQISQVRTLFRNHGRRYGKQNIGEQRKYCCQAEIFRLRLMGRTTYGRYMFQCSILSRVFRREKAPCHTSYLRSLGGRIVRIGRFLGSVKIGECSGDARGQGQFLAGSKLIGPMGRACQEMQVFQQSIPFKSRGFPKHSTPVRSGRSRLPGRAVALSAYCTCGASGMLQPLGLIT